MDAFHLTRNSSDFGMGTQGMEMCLENPKTVEFLNRSTENSGRDREWNGNFCEESWEILGVLGKVILTFWKIRAKVLVHLPHGIF